MAKKGFFILLAGFLALAGWAWFYLTQEVVLNEIVFEAEQLESAPQALVIKQPEEKKEAKKEVSIGSPSAYSLINDQKFAKDIDKVLKNVSGLKKAGKAELGGGRGSASANFNSGYAEGGSGGIGDLLSGTLGGVASTAQGRGRSNPRAPIRQYHHPKLSAANPHIEENKWHSAMESPQSTFSIDVDRASYSMVRNQLNWGHLPSPDEVRIEELINYFDYNYPEPKGEDPYNMISGLLPCPWQKGDYIARIALKSKSVDFAQAPANNIVFLIDVSGSMNRANKLPLVIASLKELVKNLRPQDQIGIVVYAGSAGAVLESTSALEKNTIFNALDRLRAGGSTAGGKGIQLAYQMAQKHFLKHGNNRVILATDGDFNVGVSSEGGLIKLIEEKRKSGVYLSVLGFGRGNYQDHKMEQLADKGNGNYAYIDGLGEAQKVLVKEMAGTLIATAKDVKVQVEFNPAQVESYRLIGYVNRKLANEDFDRDSVDAGELGAAMNVTALYQIRPKGVGGSEEKPLKYQERVLSKDAENGEWMTVKIRHKAPNASKSVLNTFPMHPEKTKGDEAMEWAMSVAGFGMLLRESPHKGDLNFDLVRRLAKSFKQKKYPGYEEKVEYLKLVQKAESLVENSGALSRR